MPVQCMSWTMAPGFLEPALGTFWPQCSVSVGGSPESPCTGVGHAVGGLCPMASPAGPLRFCLLARLAV